MWPAVLDEIKEGFLGLKEKPFKKKKKGKKYIPRKESNTCNRVSQKPGSFRTLKRD